MNIITKQERNLKTGDIFENSCGTYILGGYNSQYFLVNLETGSTWNGFKSRIEDVFSDDFNRVNRPIVLTPEA